ncbi:MAG: hypothetical protein KAT04_12990 [Methylococcales bacterium]|nr:hypothetical protein [Methylococcales bacterium]
MQLHKHFTRQEFACKCGCGFNTVDAELLGVLINLRTHFKSAVIINSGARCKKHNASVSRSEHSKHISGQAADVKVAGIHENDVADYLESEYPQEYGIIRYTGRTHIDVRANAYRYDHRKK